MAGWRDWTKARKIAMLRKHRRLPHNYRALLLPGNRRGLVTQNAAFRMACPRFVQGQSMCPAAYTVKEWLKGIALANVWLDGRGQISKTSLVDAESYHDRWFFVSQLLRRHGVGWWCGG